MRVYAIFTKVPALLSNVITAVPYSRLHLLSGQPFEDEDCIVVVKSRSFL